MSEVVINWVARLLTLGFNEEDALFPRLEDLKKVELVQAQARDPIEPMSTTHAVTKAFENASRGSERRYAPHAVKDTPAPERDVRVMTCEQSKAWSENLGHDSEATTANYYGNLTEERRFGLIEIISEKSSARLVRLSDREKIAFVDAVWEKFSSLIE